MAIPQLWTTQYLTDLYSEAEVEISTQVPSIYVRFPVSLVAGQDIYDFSTLPNPQRLTGIIRITWKGHALYPIHHQELRKLNPIFRQGVGITQGIPYMYVRQSYGLDGIKLFPAPADDLTYNNTNINTATGIKNNFIICGWRIADGVAYRIPPYLRETLIRFYVLKQAFRKEGKGQNLTAAKYYDQKYAAMMDQFKFIQNSLYSFRNHFVKDTPLFAERGGKPPRPVLPPNFGTPVY